MLLTSFTGCRKKQTSTTLVNPIPQEKARIVRIASNPEGAGVFIDDNNTPITTPAAVKLSTGKHFITVSRVGCYDITRKAIDVKEDTTTVNFTLKEMPGGEEMADFGPIGPIVFYTVPHFSCCSAGAVAYSNIFYLGTYTISGKTVLRSFDIVFPSGKVVHFDTEKLSGPVRKFSKVVTFDEVGGYEIISNGEHKYSFEVCYKPKILPGTPVLGDIFPNFDIFGESNRNAIAVPVGHEINAKVLITDAKGNPIKNKPLGVYNLKTNKDGIVTFKVKVLGRRSCYQVFVNGKKAPVEIYANLLIWGYDYARFTKDGKLIESSTKDANVALDPSMMPWFKSQAKVVVEDDRIYMPYGSFGSRLNEIYYKRTNRGGNIIIPHPEDPSIIYTNAFVSKDGGNHFNKLGVRLDTMCIDWENPSVILGWNRNEPEHLLKSTDYGLHFEKIANVSTDLENNFVVEQIVIDPSNSKRVYLATWEGLYVSQDGGSHFNLLDETPFDSLAVNPKNTHILIAGSSKGILRSEDSGKSWEVVKGNPNDDYIKCIVFDPKNPDIVYAGSRYEGLLASFDGGKTWQSLYKKFDLKGSQSIAIHPLKHNIIYVASFRDGIYKSVDGGKTFTKMDFPIGSETNIAFGSNGKLYIIDDEIPFVLNDFSESFIPLDGRTFLTGGPPWKIIDNTLFIDVSNIKEDIRSKIGKNYIEIYKACDMVP